MQDRTETLDATREATVRIRDACFDEVGARVCGAETSCLVHGRQGGSVACVSGEEDVLGLIRSLGLEGELVTLGGTGEGAS
ncbi:MAG: hypothetical protein ACQEUZ_04595 [Pseudomonadota bacterium]